MKKSKLDENIFAIFYAICTDTLTSPHLSGATPVYQGSGPPSSTTPRRQYISIFERSCKSSAWQLAKCFLILFWFFFAEQQFYFCISLLKEAFLAVIFYSAPACKPGLVHPPTHPSDKSALILSFYFSKYKVTCHRPWWLSWPLLFNTAKAGNIAEVTKSKTQSTNQGQTLP